MYIPRPDKFLRDKLLDTNLILYGPCIILQYICNPTRYTIFDDFIHNVQQLNMFPNSIVHIQSIHMLYVANWCVSIRPVVMRVKEELLCSISLDYIYITGYYFDMSMTVSFQLFKVYCLPIVVIVTLCRTQTLRVIKQTTEKEIFPASKNQVFAAINMKTHGARMGKFTLS